MDSFAQVDPSPLLGPPSTGGTEPISLLKGALRFWVHLLAHAFTGFYLSSCDGRHTHLDTRQPAQPHLLSVILAKERLGF